MKIACIGVGNVGRSWAVVFARAGHQVSLWDKNESAVKQALPLIHASFNDLQEAGIAIDVEQAMNLITVAETLETAVQDADYVQESVAEVVEVKQSVFLKLDEYAPEHCVLASSTSAISASKFLADIKGRHRCLIAHPVNPPHLIPLVELCASPWTDAKVVEQAKKIMTAVGQSPILLNKEVDGFVLNRLQWALMGEAMHLVDKGYCSVEDIDKTLTQGLALRWAFIGPFEVAHLNASQGIKGYFEVLADAMTLVRDSIQADYPPTETLINKAHDSLNKEMPVEQITDYQERRDQRILKLRQHLAETSSGVST